MTPLAANQLHTMRRDFRCVVCGAQGHVEERWGLLAELMWSLPKGWLVKKAPTHPKARPHADSLAIFACSPACADHEQRGAA